MNGNFFSSNEALNRSRIQFDHGFNARSDLNISQAPLNTSHFVRSPKMTGEETSSPYSSLVHYNTDNLYHRPSANQFGSNFPNFPPVFSPRQSPSQMYGQFAVLNEQYSPLLPQRPSINTLQTLNPVRRKSINIRHEVSSPKSNFIERMTDLVDKQSSFLEEITKDFKIDRTNTDQRRKELEEKLSRLKYESVISKVISRRRDLNFKADKTLEDESIRNILNLSTLESNKKGFDSPSKILKLKLPNVNNSKSMDNEDFDKDTKTEIGRSRFSEMTENYEKEQPDSHAPSTRRGTVLIDSQKEEESIRRKDRKHTRSHKNREKSYFASEKKKTIKLSKPDVDSSSDKTTKSSNFVKFNIRRRLSALAWTIAFPALLKNHTAQTVKTRKLPHASFMQTQYPSAITAIHRFIKQAAHKAILSIYKEKHNIYKLADHKRKLSQKEVITLAKDSALHKLKLMMEHLIKYTSDKTLSPELCGFLASISESNCIPPCKFYTEYELRRMGFSEFGTLRGMTEERSKMVLGMTLVAKVLIFQVLLHPWKEAQMFVEDESAMVSIGNKEATRERLMVFASILHIVLDESIKSKVAGDPQSQKILSFHDKIKPVSGGRLLYMPKGVDAAEYAKQNPPTDEAISGLYRREQLSHVFSGALKSETEDLRDMVEAWVDKVYGITHKYYMDHRPQVTGIENWVAKFILKVAS